jgi:peroxiredoxin
MITGSRSLPARALILLRPLLLTAALVGLRIAPLLAQSSPESASAEAGPLPGHSHMGEYFNDGPRQFAYLMAGMGRVHFPITTASPEAQAFFDQGVAQLHGFWFFEAERAFRQVLSLDSNAAMAYWGLALANREDAKRAHQFIAQATKLKSQATPREQLWITALENYFPQPKEPQNEQDKSNDKKKEGPSPEQRSKNLIRDLETIVAEHPDDLEAKAFLAWAIWDASAHNVPITSYFAVDALLAQVAAAEPMHPGLHHYRIHLWDRQRAKQALDSAELNGISATGIAHLWHMPGHIYDKLHRYADSAWQQEASGRVDHAYMLRDRVMPYLIHNYAHNQEWMCRNLSHVGQVRHAIDIASNLIAVPRHPKFNRLDKDSSCAGFGRKRLAELLVDFELWPELQRAIEASQLEPDDSLSSRAYHLRLLGLAAAGQNNQALLDTQRTALQRLEAELHSQREAALLASLEESSQTGATDDALNAAWQKAVETFDRQRSGDRHAIEYALAELDGWQALALGQPQPTVAHWKRATDIPKPRYVRALLAAGQKDEALRIAQEQIGSHPGQVEFLTPVIESLAAVGKTEELAPQFATLRPLLARADLDLPVLARLTAIANQHGIATDWNAREPAPPSTPQRPPLDSLGPLGWSPSPAPPFQLTDSAGNLRSLEAYRGKPLLLVFYLGVGCLHCVEQLKTFAPLAPQFQSEGLEVLAISTDSPEVLARSAEQFSSAGQSFPFPLASDESRQVFRAFRAFDDFEQLPLHATVLIDAQGLIRWQDISYEPFTDASFLLTEAHRLLAQPLAAP